MFEGKRQLEDLTDSSFVNATHHQTHMGKAFHAACNASRVTDKLQEPIYTVLELLRAGVVHGHRFGGPNAPMLSGGPSFGSDEEQANTLLIMRVLSVIPLNYRVSCSSARSNISPNNGQDHCLGNC